jgi:hypothetical protein
MTKSKRRRKHSDSEVAASSMLWSTFDGRRTDQTGGRGLFRNLILKNFVNVSTASGLTYRGVTEQVADRCSTPIPIEYLTETLCDSKPIKAPTVFGNPGNFFDQIAEMFEAVWWISAKGLNIQDTRRLESMCSPFDELAGGMIVEVKKKSNSLDRWLPKTVFMELAVRLDENGFKLLDNLEPQCRKKLALWNQQHQRNPIQTFVAALRSEIPWLRRGIKLRFYRANSRFLGTR